MYKRDFSDYLEDILEACEKIEKFTAKMTKEEFVQDEKTVFAVIRALEIIGEAAKIIPDAVKKKYPALPWKEITGMRDKLIHHYFGVNAYVVEKTVREDIPVLKTQIKDILEDLGEARNLP